MKKIGFDSEMYMQKQSEKILERISKFGKLYLEFGGKLFDDLHAARVLPGFDKAATTSRRTRCAPTTASPTAAKWSA